MPVINDVDIVKLYALYDILLKFTLCGFLRDPRSLSNTCTWYRYKKPMKSKDRQQTFGSFIYHLKVLLLTLYEQLQCTKD